MHKIFVVTHLQSNLKLPDGYSYIKVGGGDFVTEFDDKLGRNISSKNPFYCELTALYWIWKNYECDPERTIGLAHYRRVLCEHSPISFLLKKPLALSKINRLLQQYDLVLPNKVEFERGIYSQYGEAHDLDDLDLCLNYLTSSSNLNPLVLKKFKEEKRASVYNMIICKKRIFDSYCEWLFNILFAVESDLKLSERTGYQQRVAGFLSERLFNLWLIQNPKYKTICFPILRMDKSGFSNLNRLRKKAF
jgi:hypothetical protein